MLINRDGWQYSGKTPAFFSGQSGCYCCGVGIGTYICLYGFNFTSGNLRDVDSYVVDSWTSKTDGATPARSTPQTGTVEGVAYIYGGSGSVSPFYFVDNDAYVFSTDTFTAKTDMSAARWFGAGFAAALKCYASYGYDNTTTRTQTNYEYSPSADSWATKTSGPNPVRSGPSSFVISDNGYVIGGGDASGNFLKDNDQYATGSDAWTSKTDMGTARSTPGAFTIDGTGWALMGFSTGSVMVGTTESYDASGNAWTAGNSIGGTRDKRYRGASASLGSTGAGYMTGGLTALATQSRHHDEFDGTTWTTRTDMPTPARDQLIGAESV
jgi:hypothetical protein